MQFFLSVHLRVCLLRAARLPHLRRLSDQGVYGRTRRARRAWGYPWSLGRAWHAKPWGLWQVRRAHGRQLALEHPVPNVAEGAAPSFPSHCPLNPTPRANHHRIVLHGCLRKNGPVAAQRRSHRGPSPVIDCQAGCDQADGRVSPESWQGRRSQ